MRAPVTELVKIASETPTPLSAIWIKPHDARACLVLAHGAGAGMTHAFMEQVATGLAQHGVATLRFQFPYMEKGSKRPDQPAVAHAAIRDAVAEARRRCGKRPLLAGGKSFGGRMTSQAQALAPLGGVRGLVFLGFPLHPAGNPSVGRAEHLDGIRVPMLFVQGTRDKLAEPELLAPVVRGLGKHATLHPIADADHAFHVPARTGRRDSDVISEICGAVAGWIDREID
ncbi:alpha/beta hydrolase family protein [Rhodopseudomonas telluris]|uniref:Alpha/beta family hydrolase n=1 Tax=Rhodopseudomonas telluris TaxID=644215 RepID=A0ABV6EZZ8_9BRAD